MAIVSLSEGFSAALTGVNLFQHILGPRHQSCVAVSMFLYGGFYVFTSSVSPHINKNHYKAWRMDGIMRKVKLVYFQCS